jgi:formylglycine-generating enzyme required for sulfatase activity
MAGNVKQWTSTLYQHYPYNSGDGREDLNKDGKRVIRGSAWYSDQKDARCTSRDIRTYTTGFRCCWSASKSKD